MDIRKELKRLRKTAKKFNLQLDELEQQLEPEITEGQYWKGKNGIFRIVGKSNKVNYEWYAKQILSTTSCTGFHDNKNSIRENYTLLSDNEVEQALIEEAKRRGFVTGAKYINASHPHKREVIGGHKHTKPRFRYVSGTDILTDGWGGSCYKQGQFAEIIGHDLETEGDWEPKMIDYGDFTLKNHKHKKILNLRDEPLSKWQAITLCEKLNKLDCE